MYRLLSRYTWPVILIAISFGLAGVPAVHAQGETTLINIGENKIGEVTAEQPTPAYLLTVFEPQPVDIQVLAVSQGFAPALRVFDPAGALAQEATNTGSATVTDQVARGDAGVPDRWRAPTAARPVCARHPGRRAAAPPTPGPGACRRRREQQAPRQRYIHRLKRTRCCCT